MIEIKEEIIKEGKEYKNILYTEYLKMYKGLYYEKYAIIYARQQLGQVSTTKNKLLKDYEVRVVENRFYFYQKDTLVDFTYLDDYEGSFLKLRELLEESLKGQKVLKRQRYGKITNRSTIQ